MLTQVRCPVPSALTGITDYRIRLQWQESVEEETDAFPVCSSTTAAESHLSLSSSLSSPSSSTNSAPFFSVPYTVNRTLTATTAKVPPRFQLSICTVSSTNSAPEDLHMFIDHYRALMVQHFFIYDTSPNSMDNKPGLNEVLKSYIDTGAVTVIPWHYSSCIDADPFRCPDPVLHFSSHAEPTVVPLFRPPAQVQAEAALSSCFLRFRRYSEWILAVDKNEFIYIDKSKYLGHVKVVHIPSLLNSAARAQPGTNFVDFEVRSYRACHSQPDDIPFARQDARWVRAVDSLNISFPEAETKESIISTRVHSAAVRSDVPLSRVCLIQYTTIHSISAVVLLYETII